MTDDGVDLRLATVNAKVVMGDAGARIAAELAPYTTEQLVRELDRRENEAHRRLMDQEC